MKNRQFWIVSIGLVILCSGVLLFWKVSWGKSRSDKPSERTTRPTKRDAREKDHHPADTAHQEPTRGSKERGGHDTHLGRRRQEHRVRLTSDQRNELGIEVASARPGVLHTKLELSGEIVLNIDRLVHVVPQVSGLVRDVVVSVGDTVEEGDLMASLDSRELSDAKAAFLKALERRKLARTEHERERRLWKKGGNE